MKRANSEAMNKTKTQLDSVLSKPDYRKYWGVFLLSFFVVIFGALFDINKASATTWAYKGIAFYAYNNKSTEGTKPVYKFYSSSRSTYFYTISKSQKDKLINGSYGRSIKVGIKLHTPAELRDNSFRIKANKNYVIKNKNGNIISKVSAGTRTRVKYDGNGNLRVYSSIPKTIVNGEVRFEAADGNNLSMIFDVYHAQYRYDGNYYDNYRGKIKLKYSKTYDNCTVRYGRDYCGYNRSTGKKRVLIWAINEIPLEQYTWGMGEITGTGPMEYNKLMTTVYRTYGYWWYRKGTKYSDEGFDLRSTSGNQIYSGYDWEVKYPRIKKGAQSTRGKIVKYSSRIAIVPYSSWTDGRTRSFKERWGSTNYPWCQSVPDPYGDYNGKYWDKPYMSTRKLVNAGNHMVGMSAHGALTLAHDKDWGWKKILNYYINNVRTVRIY